MVLSLSLYIIYIYNMRLLRGQAAALGRQVPVMHSPTDGPTTWLWSILDSTGIHITLCIYIYIYVYTCIYTSVESKTSTSYRWDFDSPDSSVGPILTHAQGIMNVWLWTHHTPFHNTSYWHAFQIAASSSLASWSGLFAQPSLTHVETWCWTLT